MFRVGMCLTNYFLMLIGQSTTEIGSGSPLPPFSVSTFGYTLLLHFPRSTTKTESESRVPFLDGHSISRYSYTRPMFSFVRHFIPQLKKYPKQYIYEPWKAPLSVQQSAG